MTNYTIAYSSFMDLLVLPNQFTDGLFWSFIVLTVWLLMFIGLSKGNNTKGLSISFLVCLILSMLLNWAGLVSNIPITICFIGFLISLFLTKGSEV